jgi:hypothetical protein
MESLQDVTKVAVLALVMDGDSLALVQEHLNPLQSFQGSMVVKVERFTVCHKMLEFVA